ncbi:hypothetical protein B0H10DRAFT_2222400 [Mycena sp. CBHHK59/15]|nr:hypothetical protein B0H10DRAFT_2222400 [Mycena sp. CBHHK59/15]
MHKVKIHWMPTHIGITGNKAINTCTKEVALGTSTLLSSCIMLFFEALLPTLKATTIADGIKVFTLACSMVNVTKAQLHLHLRLHTPLQNHRESAGLEVIHG